MKPVSFINRKKRLSFMTLLITVMAIAAAAMFMPGVFVQAARSETAWSEQSVRVSAFPQTYDAGRRGSVTIELSDIGTDRENVKLSLYKVGVMEKGSSSVRFLWTEALRDVSTLKEMDLNNIVTADDTQNVIAALENVLNAVDAPIQPLETGITDENGVARFGFDTDGEGILEPGMYLIMQTGDNNYGIISSLLVSIPCSDDGQQVKYDVVLMPKAAENLPEGYYQEKPSTENTRDMEANREEQNQESNHTGQNGSASSSNSRSHATKTGDPTQTLLWGCILVAAVIGLIAEFRSNRKEK